MNDEVTLGCAQCRKTFPESEAVLDEYCPYCHCDSLWETESNDE